MISEQKQTLREQVRLRLNTQTTAAARLADSHAIASRLASVLQSHPMRCALGFAPMASEPHWWLDGGPDPIRFAFPKIVGNAIAFFRIHHANDLTRGTFGIQEPPDFAEQRISIADADVILVPGVAFDSNGGRLGRGRGFYDSILGLVGPDCLTIGLAFDCQIVDTVPLEPHDRAVTMVMTPTRMLVPPRR